MSSWRRGTSVIDDLRSVSAGAAVAPSLSPEAPDDQHDLEELRTLVTLTRHHPRDIGQRHVYVRIDDGPRVALLFGQSFTVEVQPGTHRLRAHNTLMWRTLTFHVEAGEHLEFLLINRGGPLTYSVAALLGAAPLFLSIERRSVV
jgi:hypothetical protein